jgi:hypothetical protein
MNNFVGALVALFLSATSALQPAIITPITEEPPSPEQIALTEFLASKKSPMPAEVLIKYPNWRMILAISAAESGYCKHQAAAMNCYGIKDFQPGARPGSYRAFSSWEESISFASRLLYKYDAEDGAPEPHAMVARWKAVLPYTGWLNNVSHSLRDIDRNMQIATAT